MLTGGPGSKRWSKRWPNRKPASVATRTGAPLGGGGGLGTGAIAYVCNDPVLECNPFGPPAEECAEGAGCYIEPGGTDCLAAGSKPEGSVCYGDSPNSCIPGLQCAIVCSQICSVIDNNADQPKCDNACPTGVRFPLASPVGAAVCVTANMPSLCNLYTQTGCPDGKACYIVTGGAACADAGNLQLGAVCQYTDECAPGTICASGTCKTLCSLDPNAVPNDACDQKCAAGHEIVVPTLWNVGVCSN